MGRRSLSIPIAVMTPVIMLFVVACVGWSCYRFALVGPIIGNASNNLTWKHLSIPTSHAILALCAAGAIAISFSNPKWSLTAWGLSISAMFILTHALWHFEPTLHVEGIHSLNNRLIQLRNQLEKLQEKEQLDTLLTKTTLSHHALAQLSDRFELILMTIENHLLMGDHEQAEKIITLFARHLRQILYEGSTPFLPLSASIEHVQTHLELMQMLTAQRFSCDIDDGMLEVSTRSRYTPPLLISSWVQEVVWPYFSLAERSLEGIGESILVMDLEADQLVISFTPPQSMYLPEFSHEHVTIKRFRLLGTANWSDADFHIQLKEQLEA